MNEIEKYETIEHIATEREIKESNLANDVDIQIQIRSTQYLREAHVRHRTGLNSRVHQLKGMIEVVELLPEHNELMKLLERLQAHLAWLEQKQKSWPV